MDPVRLLVMLLGGIFAIMLIALITVGFAGLGAVPFVVWVFCAASFYALPTIIALMVKHDKLGLIAVTNLLFGWTIVWWIVALSICIDHNILEE